MARRSACSALPVYLAMSHAGIASAYRYNGGVQVALRGFGFTSKWQRLMLNADTSLGCEQMIAREEYIEQRLNDQISWYARKSRTNQLWFKRLRLAEIVAAAITLDGAAIREGTRSR